MDMSFFRPTLPDVEDLEWPHYWQVYSKVEWDEGSEEYTSLGPIQEFTSLMKLTPLVRHGQFFIETRLDDFLSMVYYKRDKPGEAWGCGSLANEMDDGDLIRPIRIDYNLNVIPCEWPVHS